MKLIYLALLGPVLWLGTAPLFVAAIPVALAALLGFLEACHASVEKIVGAQKATDNATEKDAEGDEPDSDSPIENDRIRRKLLAAGVLAPSAATLAAAHSSSTAVPSVSLSEPLAYDAIAQQLERDLDELVSAAPSEQSSTEANPLMPGVIDTFVVNTPDVQSVSQNESSPLSLGSDDSNELAFNQNFDPMSSDDWSSSAQGY